MSHQSGPARDTASREEGVIPYRPYHTAADDGRGATSAIAPYDDGDGDDDDEESDSQPLAAAPAVFFCAFYIPLFFFRFH